MLGFCIVHDGQRIRTALIHGIHLHPKDVGGAILSLDQAEPPEAGCGLVTTGPITAQ